MTTKRLIFFLFHGLLAAVQAAPSANVDWATYLGDKQRSLYSPLRQIDRNNVAQLQVAWTYDTGERGEYQANNLIIAGVLYTATPSRKVIALNAETGLELWTWDPVVSRAGTGGKRQRGLVFWENPGGGERRLFTAVGNYLFALDPQTGRLISSFGDNGSIHLGSGLDTEVPPKVGLNTPGVIYRDILIIGGFGGPGAVRGFDVRTGARRWVFHLIPRPGEFGYDTWPVEAYKTATGLMPWSGQALDEKRGIVYIATKTAEPDFYGAERHGQNLFANSLVALDAATGKRLWHYQIVHHDLLDKDLPCAPVLLTVKQGGHKIDAVAQGTKHGYLFVFDRATGRPLWPIEEKPVPASELRGEQAWPTQPFPSKPAPLMRQRYTKEDVSAISPDALALTQDRIRLSPNFGPFPAPSLKETIMFPGFDGGMEWGGGAADPEGIYYVNVNEIPWILQMVETRRPDGTSLPRGERDYLIHCEEKASDVFKRLFLTGSPAETERQIRRLELGKSILDTVAEQAHSLQRSLGGRDRDRLDQYFTSVRDLEKRMIAAQEWEHKPKPHVTAPVPLDPESPRAYMEKVKLMYDIARLAFETDSTRIITLLLDSVNSPAIELGGVAVSDGYHNLSHHGKAEAKLSQLKAIDEWHMKLLSQLYGDLKSVREDGDSLLDRTMVLYGSNLGNAHAHTTTNLPTLFAGGGFKHGQHLAFDLERNYPLPNLFVSMLQRMGIETDKFASSTGTMRGLELA